MRYGSATAVIHQGRVRASARAQDSGALCGSIGMPSMWRHVAACHAGRAQGSCGHAHWPSPPIDRMTHFLNATSGLQRNRLSSPGEGAPTAAHLTLLPLLVPARPFLSPPANVPALAYIAACNGLSARKLRAGLMPVLPRLSARRGRTPPSTPFMLPAFRAAFVLEFSFQTAVVSRCKHDILSDARIKKLSTRSGGRFQRARLLCCLL